MIFAAKVFLFPLAAHALVRIAMLPLAEPVTGRARAVLQRGVALVMIAAPGAWAAFVPPSDALRAKMQVRENAEFTRDYYNLEKRFIGNAVQVFFKDGSSTERVAVDFPIGHRKRRAEGMPVLVKKFETSVAAHFTAKQTESIKALFANRERLEQLPVHEFVAGLVKN